MTTWGRWSNARPIEVYPSSDSSLPTNISSRKKRKKDREGRTCQRRGIAASKNMKHQNSWKVRQVSKDFTSCKGSKVIEIWVHMRREPHRQDKSSDLCAEAGLCLYFCCCQVWGKLAPAGFSFPPGLLMFTSAPHHSCQAVTGVLQGPVLGHFSVVPNVLESQ